MTSWTSPRAASIERYSGWSRTAVSVRRGGLQVVDRLEQGEMPTEQVGPPSAPGSSRPTSLSRTATSRTSLTDSHMLIT